MGWQSLLAIPRCEGTGAGINQVLFFDVRSHIFGLADDQFD
jgi:hypothetical protein